MVSYSFAVGVSYFSIYQTRYLWLDTNKWRWVISNSTIQDNSTAYRHDEAYCSVTTLNDTVDPSICEDWRLLVYSGGVVTGEITNDLVVRGAICEISDHCMSHSYNHIVTTYHYVLFLQSSHYTPQCNFTPP